MHTLLVRRQTTRLLAAALGAHLGGCGGEKVAPPAPTATTTWVDTLPPVPTSYLDVPVRYDLSRALAWLESAVPTVIGNIDQRHRAPGNSRLRYAYSLRRRPFKVEIEGRTATLGADFEYQVRAWYNPPLLPEISASCGTEEDKPRPRAQLMVRTNVELTDRWRLRPRTTASARPLTETGRDECEVTAFKVDVTEKVLHAARSALQRKLAEFDRRLAAFDLPGEAGHVWSVLSNPIKLTDSLWLVINPEAVRIGLLAVRHDTLVTTVGLSANPRVIGGARPQVAERLMPAPQDSTSRPPVLHLLTEGRMPYDVASAVLSRELRGTRIRVAGRSLTVDSLHLLGVGDGRVAVGLAVRGAANGTLYAVGHPMLDTATAELYMPDLIYDVGTRDLLVGTLAWLASGTIEEFLRNQVRIKMGPVIEEGRQLLERELNRDLADGVTLRAKVQSGRVFGVRAAPRALLARAIVSGQGELVLDILPNPPPAAPAVVGR
ncbi:MAG TPA: DUF4403 family protein [Gemmatimonadales bacterium]|jgi:hypothetical protein|nr:DUF4403 family protein [Gemmatimonadales bacterium]